MNERRWTYGTLPEQIMHGWLSDDEVLWEILTEPCDDCEESGYLGGHGHGCDGSGTPEACREAGCPYPCPSCDGTGRRLREGVMRKWWHDQWCHRRGGQLGERDCPVPSMCGDGRWAYVVPVSMVAEADGGIPHETRIPHEIMRYQECREDGTGEES